MTEIQVHSVQGKINLSADIHILTTLTGQYDVAKSKVKMEFIIVAMFCNFCTLLKGIMNSQNVFHVSFKKTMIHIVLCVL